ncbi:MAG: protein kinase, partial [Myxococcales bacterium]|nr:protein kinase [Myxococcales bacterium]
EYVEGVDLMDLIREQRVPPRALAELGAELAGTMHRAHTAMHPNTGAPLKVIHRDVKPANVMVTSRGGVRLLDFGMARAAFASRESQTQGLVLGTLNYFPPEILAGREPTSAVDLYGLGLTMWECATGKDWGSPQVHRHRFERRVEQRMAEVHESYRPLMEVLRKLLQWNPEERPTGDIVERQLLAAADECAGSSLRVWAREVVPPILSRRQAEARSDEMVGRTFTVETGGAGPVALQPLPPDLQVQRTASKLETHTYNDLAPPAAVQRRQERDNRPTTEEPISPEVDTAPLPELEIENTGQVENPEEEPEPTPPPRGEPHGVPTLLINTDAPEFAHLRAMAAAPPPHSSSGLPSMWTFVLLAVLAGTVGAVFGVILLFGLVGVWYAVR